MEMSQHFKNTRIISDFSAGTANLYAIITAYILQPANISAMMLEPFANKS